MNEFVGMELIQENVKVAWEYIDEGKSGYYNPDDPEDVPLLRFSVFKKDDETNEWEYVEDSSYCTNFPLHAPDDVKQKGLETIMDLVFESVQEDYSIKKLCERISYIDESCEVPLI